MDAIEVLAVLFAFAVLIKMVFFIVSPEPLFKFSEKLVRQRTFLTVAYVILIGIIGHFLFDRLTVAEVAAAILFTGALYGLTFIPYVPSILKLFDEIPRSASARLRKFWLSSVIWVLLAISVLVSVFG